MKSNIEVSDEEMEVCFGTKRKCDRNCRMKQYCQEEAKEHAEDRRRRKYRETEYHDEIDPESDAAHVKPDYAEDEDERNGDLDTSDLLHAIDTLDAPANIRKELKDAVKRRDEIEANRETMGEMLTRLGEIYVFDQTGFEVMFFQALNGVNSSQLSKMRGCTKQNISKKLKRGRERLTAYRKEFQSGKMNGRELGVYYFVFVRKMSFRQAAEQLGINAMSVSRTVKKLRKTSLACYKKTHVSRIAYVFRKKAKGKPLTAGEETIYQDVINREKSVREVSKLYRCPSSTVYYLRKRYSSVTLDVAH